MRRNLWDEILYFFKSHSLITRLIAINVAVFIIVNIIGLFFFLANTPQGIGYSNPLVLWLSVPSDIGALLAKPWTIFTYMFLQVNFFHLFFNMYILYFGGRIFVNYLTRKQLLTTYIVGGLVGAAFYIIAFNVFPVFDALVKKSIALGASASVLAILVAIATYVPNYSLYLLFLGKVKLKYIALVFVAIDILSIDKGNPGGHIAHLGGAFWGFIYATNLKKGNDIGKIFYSFGNAIKSFFYTTKKSNLNVEYKREKPISDDEYNKMKAERQKRIDKILDKISKSGYQSLTKEEKEFLFKMGNKNQ